MSGFMPIDFGERIPGQGALDATGSTSAAPFLLTKKTSIFTTVPSGAVAGLPSSYSSGTELVVLNRGANALSVQPPSADQIEGYGLGVAVEIAPGGNARFTSFDMPAAGSPRTWWLT